MAGSTETTALVNQLESDTFDWLEAMGGWRGILESSTPIIVFLLAFILTRNLWLTAALAGGISIAFLLIRLVLREALAPAFGGLIAVSVSILWALLSGKAENFFAFGLLKDAAFAFLLAASTLASKPAVAWILTLLWQLPPDWERETSYAAFIRATRVTTWLWAALFSIRVLVQTPLWWGGYVEALATTKLILGLPLMVVTTWMSWLILRPYSALLTMGASKTRATSSMTDAD